IAAQKSAGTSVLDRLGGERSAPAADPVAPAGDLLPPPAGDTAPLVPRAD
ncbi:MAG: preprotein translocase subunit SecG, partial [Paracoccaceae bacterium]|nr:preprotein translocase subunit SecG [Paracoccaceae bacterium]